MTQLLAEPGGTCTSSLLSSHFAYSPPPLPPSPPPLPPPSPPRCDGSCQSSCWPAHFQHGGATTAWRGHHCCCRHCCCSPLSRMCALAHSPGPRLPRDAIPTFQFNPQPLMCPHTRRPPSPPSPPPPKPPRSARMHAYVCRHPLRPAPLQLPCTPGLLSCLCPAAHHPHHGRRCHHHGRRRCHRGRRRPPPPRLRCRRQGC